MKLAVVIVFFHPSEADVDMARVLGSRYEGVIVDNSESSQPEADFGHIEYIANLRNAGIAGAQNAGIAHCLHQLQATHIVFLDQDSRVSPDYPDRMVTEYEKVRRWLPNLGSLGPAIVNQQTGEVYTSDIHHDHHLSPTVIEKSFIISSGSCVSSEVLDVVGMNTDSLFMDFVDSEWCWRARAEGYVCAMTQDIRMSHQVGRKLIHVGPFRDILSAPPRYFFQFRNYLWLTRLAYVPRKWKVLTGLKYLLRMIYVPFTPHGLRSYWNIWRGIIAGFRNPLI